MCIKEVFNRIIVCRSGYHNEVCIAIGFAPVKCSTKIQILLCKILFNIFILYRRYTFVQFLHFLRDYIHCRHLMMLCQQCSNTHSNVTGPGYSYLILFHFSYCYNQLDFILMIRNYFYWYRRLERTN